MKTETEKIWVLYHADCLDGYGAAWAAWKVFGQQAHYQPVRHQAPIPDFPKDARLYILDFCYSPDVLVSAAKKASKICVLDHHMSAQKAFNAYQKQSNIPANLDIRFEQNHSGCVMAWQYFHEDSDVPQLLLHIEDNDLWKHQLPNTVEIIKALYLRLSTPFSSFEKIKIKTLHREGIILHKQHWQTIQRLLKSRHSITLNNKKGLAVNAPGIFSSDLGHELAKISGTFGLTYHFHGKRNCYECGIRSVGDYDVAKIATFYGGGGHQNAAGFSLEKNTFLDCF